MTRRGPVLTWLVAAALLGAEYLAVGHLIPAVGSTRNGAPSPILFLGVVGGLVYGLTAAGVILIYRSMRVINFAQTVLGAGGVVLMYNFMTLTPVPFPIALVLGLVVSGLAGLAFELIFVRRFFRAPRLVLTVFTIVAASFLSGFARSAVDRLPFFPDVSERTVGQLAGDTDLSPHLPFRGFHFTLPGSPIRFGFAPVLAIVLAVVALVGLSAFLRFTRLGVAVRAMASNSERAVLLGISVGLLSSVVWSMAGVLSGVGGAMTALLGEPSASFAFAPDILLVALAAAVLGRMRNIGIAVAAAVGIKVLSESVAFLQPDYQPLVSGLLLLIVAGGLLLQRRGAERSEAGGARSWEATEEIRPVPRELAVLPAVRAARWIAVLIAAAGVVVYPFVVSTAQTYLATVIVIQAILALSLVVLTGWTGQVSLGQFGLAAVGAVVAGAIAVRLGWPFWVAVPAACILTTAVAVLLGLPALRLPGLHLAVATFAFAAAVPAVLFNAKAFGWLLPEGQIHRPTLPFVDFEDERSMYFLCIVALALVLVGARNLRASRFGRILIGVRENEPNVQSAAVSPLRMKLVAFAIAGGLAGLAGALIAYHARGVTAQSFGAQASIDIFVVSVIGGISSILGPLVGSAVINGLRTGLQSFPEIALGITPLFAIIILYIAPGGLMSVVAKMRDGVLRIIAQRNQLVVPSLFADLDPEALHLQLVPMAAANEHAGLAQLRQRYDIGSLHADERRRSVTDDERDALVAAVRSVEGADS